MKNLFLIIICSIPLLCQAQWNQLGEQIIGDESGDSFGSSTSINEDGNVIAVGALFNSTQADNGGQAKVFELIDDNWVQRGDTFFGEEDNFLGNGVALTREGNTIAIGASIAENTQGIRGAGVIRVYDWDGTEWNQRGNQLDGEGNPNEFIDSYGAALGISDDGNIVAGGARGNDGTATNAGNVIVYQWNGDSWEQMGEDIDGLALGDSSGASLSLSADGTVVAIGAPFSSENGMNSGQARVFQWDGTSWNQMGSTVLGDFQGNQAGRSVSLNANGTTLAVSMPSFDPTQTNGPNGGSVRIYDWDGTDWVQRGDTLVGNEQSGEFGKSISLNKSGSIIVIGASNQSSTGKSYVFQWDGAAWIQIGASIDGEEIFDFSGNSVGINGDGNRVIIGEFGFGDEGRIRTFENLEILQVDNFLHTATNLYPNPVVDVLTVSSQQNIQRIVIYNQLGQKVASYAVNTNEIAINVQGFSSGVYVAQLQTDTTQERIKFIKK